MKQPVAKALLKDLRKFIEAAGISADDEFAWSANVGVLVQNVYLDLVVFKLDLAPPGQTLALTPSAKADLAKPPVQELVKKLVRFIGFPT